MKTWITHSGYQLLRILGGRSNVFLMSNGRADILIDTSPKFMWPRLRNRLNRNGICHIDYLILTHSHFDHANNARRIKELYGAKVIVHQAEADRLSNGKMLIPEGSNAFSRMIVRFFDPLFSSIIACEPCEPDLLVADRLDLQDFGFNGYILHTPGHSPGSLSVIVDDEVAFVGDAMVGVFPWSVYPPFLEDHQQLIESWGKLLATGCSWFIPSHGSANSRMLVEKCFHRMIKRINQ